VRYFFTARIGAGGSHFLAETSFPGSAWACTGDEAPPRGRGVLSFPGSAWERTGGEALPRGRRDRAIDLAAEGSYNRFLSGPLPRGEAGRAPTIPSTGGTPRCLHA